MSVALAGRFADLCLYLSRPDVRCAAPARTADTPMMGTPKADRLAVAEMAAATGFGLIAETETLAAAEMTAFADLWALTWIVAAALGVDLTACILRLSEEALAEAVRMAERLHRRAPTVMTVADAVIAADADLVMPGRPSNDTSAK